jgi:hypothetical protein
MRMNGMFMMPHGARSCRPHLVAFDILAGTAFNDS